MALPLLLDQPTRPRASTKLGAAVALRVVGQVFAHRVVRAIALVAIMAGAVVAWRALGWSALVGWLVATVVGWLVALVGSVRT